MTSMSVAAATPPGSVATALRTPQHQHLSLDYLLTTYWQEHGDPRLSKSPLVGGGPWQMFGLVLAYLTIVTSLGPYLMRSRKPMTNLVWPMRAYNLFMVCFNAYLYISFSLTLRFGLDSWGCGDSTKLVADEHLYLWELFLLSRYFDFFDSLFFVCRKKFDHLSLLHVVHHSIVPIIIWFAAKFAATPMVVFAGYINLPIHVIMYAYYGLSTFPTLKKYLWWKKYITTIQIIQFLIDLVHSLQAIFNPNCKCAPITYVQFFFSISFIYLFGQFYLKSYTKQHKSNSNNENNNDNNHITSSKVKKSTSMSNAIKENGKQD